MLALGPVRLFDLEPVPRPAADVDARLILCDQPLIAALEYLGPRLQAVRRQATHGVDPVGLSHEILEPGPPLAQRPAADVATLHVQEIEHDQHGRRRQFDGLPMPEPVETRAELGVEDRELAVEYQRRRRWPAYRGGDVGIPPRVVD